jgi:NAD(P)-dependent dehydrogenase (short-subunit alcohol dehydrogenase family)
VTTTRIAVITGGGTGIGRATAEALAAEGGWALVLAGRRREPLDEAAAAVAALGAEVLVVPTDVGEPEQVDHLFEQTMQRFGRVDLLFNNAGGGTAPVPMEDLSFEQWQRCVAVNLTGSFLCAQRAIRIMKAQDPQGGRIINNGSISATTPRPCSAPYTSTKHAVTGLTKSIALDGRPFGITCGQIDVGNAATALTARMASGVLQADGSTAAEPTMDVADVGRAVAFMAGLPPDTNMLSVNIMAAGMPFVGRG